MVEEEGDGMLWGRWRMWALSETPNRRVSFEVIRASGRGGMRGPIYGGACLDVALSDSCLRG